MNLKNIPSVNEILLDNKFSLLKINRTLLKKIINNIIVIIRKDNKQILSKEKMKNTIINNVLLKIDEYKVLELNSVVNGTGVILHTNLGRAPISKEISKKIAENLSNYNDLEIDIKHRYDSRIKNIRSEKDREKDAANMWKDISKYPVLFHPQNLQEISQRGGLGWNRFVAYRKVVKGVFVGPLYFRKNFKEKFRKSYTVVKCYLSGGEKSECQ